MEVLDLDFEWPRATYVIKRDPDEPSETALVSTSRPTLRRIDRKSFETSVVGIAELSGMTDGAVIERRVKLLCDHLGMLSHRSMKGQSEPMRIWLHASETIVGIFNKQPMHKGWIGILDMLFAPSPSGGFNVVVRPHQLFDAIVYSAARMTASGIDIRRCEWCAKPFQTGGRTNVRKIASAKFCSDQCRYDFNNARRRKI